ncbi:MAG: M23 family metallopeptidase [Hyphomicrobium sp.]|uniref:M23 family metallopeptidase n=1 Tax=Hyphomicrobium sp. TaxID=82 RepID=UPI003D1270A1
MQNAVSIPLLIPLWGLLLAPLLLASAPHQANAGTDCESRTAATPLVTRRPVSGEDVRLTSGYGLRLHPLLNERRLHTGVDWAAPTGTPVTAAGKGRVISAGREGFYGNKVVIDHGGGWQSVYAQLDRFSVKAGDCVEARDQIGTVGTTGLSSGPHLHFEVLREGQTIDPMSVPLQAEEH